MSVSVWQHVKLSEQISPWDTLACCWDVKQPANQPTRSLADRWDTTVDFTTSILKRGLEKLQTSNRLAQMYTDRHTHRHTLGGELGAKGVWGLLLGVCVKAGCLPKPFRSETSFSQGGVLFVCFFLSFLGDGGRGEGDTTLLGWF